MDATKYLIVGAGMSGLAFANFVDSDDYLILERDDEIGGYCKTVHQDGFVWDYSGHFFHFRHPEIEQYLVDRMPKDQVQTIEKCSQIFYKGELIDFPFQKNIHQLPKDEFIECLSDLYFATPNESPAHFKEMVISRFGQAIADKFLIPYNEKLYACDLAELDADAMGRFFPYADLEGIIRNFRTPDNNSYNARFTYPKGGAIEYVKALASETKEGSICLGEGLVSLDMRNKVATTTKRKISFEYLISSAPFDKLAQMTIRTTEEERKVFRSNKVQVFNLGFDRKGWDQQHWVYFPERKYSFYRIGFYDNIFNTDRMSLYVELGMATDAPESPDEWLTQVLADLETAGIVDGHKLVSHHQIMLNPAYAHITKESVAAVDKLREVLGAKGIYSIGRYGGWTYCAIEDNIVEAKKLAGVLNAANADA